MDQRVTVSANGGFAELLARCYDNNEKVAMIVDDGGMQRMEGLIKDIHFDAEPPFFELEDGTTVKVHTVIAINGIFLSNYSEC